MHRGSSKGDRSPRRPPEILPLSASSPWVRVVVEVTRGGRSTRREVELPRAQRVRDALKMAGEAPEGCAVLIGGKPVPLDLAIEDEVELTVIPVFSGG